MSKVMVLGGWQHLLMLLHSIVVFFCFNRPGLKVGWYMLLVGLVVGWPIRKQIPCFLHRDTAGMSCDGFGDLG
mgnify:CR=1 FL=1